MMVKKEEEGKEREGEQIREEKDKGMTASGPCNESTSTCNKVCTHVLMVRYSNFDTHTNFLFSDGHIM